MSTHDSFARSSSSSSSSSTNSDDVYSSTIDDDDDDDDVGVVLDKFEDPSPPDLPDRWDVLGLGQAMVQSLFFNL